MVPEGPHSCSAIIYRSIIFQGTPSSEANLAGCRSIHIGAEGMALVQTAANPCPT